MKLSEQMRIKHWLDGDSAAYVKAVVAIWTDRVVILEAVVEAAKVCRLRFGLDAPDKQDALVMLFDALAALEDNA